MLESDARAPAQKALRIIVYMGEVRLPLLRQKFGKGLQLEQLDKLEIECSGHESDLDKFFGEIYNKMCSGSVGDCSQLN